MDFDPSSATSLLDLQPDIPRGDDHDLQNPCLSNLHRSIFSFPSSESSGKNCSPGGGVVDEPVTAAAGPEELAAAGVTGILFFSHGSSPDGLTFLLLLPVFSRDDPHDTPPDMKNNSRRTTQVYVFGEEFRRMFGRFDQVEDEFVFEEPQDIKID